MVVFSISTYAGLFGIMVVSISFAAIGNRVENPAVRMIAAQNPVAFGV
jgi:hypothetical protein